MTQTAPSLKAAYAEAMAQMGRGKLAEALRVFGRIHDANPRIAEVEYQIARIFLALDDMPRALIHAAAAARLAPAQLAVWKVWADAVALAGSSDARDAFLDAIKTAPIPTQARLRLQDRFGALKAGSKPALGGVAERDVKDLVHQLQGGHAAAAAAKAQQLLSAHPGSAMVANILGSAFATLGRAEDAVQMFRRSAQIDPDYAEAHANMAPVLVTLGRLDEAQQACREAIMRAPHLRQALTGLGQLLLGQGDAAKAVFWLGRAAQEKPAQAETLLALGNAQTQLRDFAAARDAFRAAVALTGRKRAQPIWMLAQALSHLGEDAEAEALFREALTLAPEHPGILGSYGLFLQGLGRFDDADPVFRRAFAADPQGGELYRLFLASHKVKPGDPILAEMRARFDEPGLSDRSRMGFGFAIAKALEDVKDYAAVFDYLDPANALMRKAHPYDSAVREGFVRQLMQAMDSFDWHAARVEGTTDEAPIFVTGMPRSGTTLVEQIIASHPRVTGAGEVADGTVAAQKLLMTSAGTLRKMASLSGAEIAGLGHDYAAMIRARFPEADRITDKSIQTYLYLGLLKLALPKARFIVVRRDPRDTLLSMYKNVFPEGTHLHAYDQVDLAKYYGTFVSMVDFWRARVPDWFHEVCYEDLVSDPEPHSRALIAACGLDWDDACLNFHANTRKVETLSVFQVRQPISKGSVRAWERYGDRLKPLLDQLRRDGHIGE